MIYIDAFEDNVDIASTIIHAKNLVSALGSSVTCRFRIEHESTQPYLDPVNNEIRYERLLAGNYAPTPRTQDVCLCVRIRPHGGIGVVESIWYSIPEPGQLWPV